jgi:IS30 family transposase
MAGSGRTGPVPLTAQRELFARLIGQGMSNSEACRQVGVNRRTGTRWRLGRRIPNASGAGLQYPPVITCEPRPISRRYLCEEERGVIADLHRACATVREIAVVLGRSPSTVSRELARNRDPDTRRYRPAKAQRLAAERRTRPRKRRVDRDPVLADFIQDRLEEQWSPEQISRALSVEFVGQAARQLVPESIYRAVYDRGCALTRDRDLVLQTRRRRRIPHRRGDSRRPGGLPAPMAMVSQRPVGATDRLEPGHWEGDFIMGAGNRSAIGTLVERTSRKTVLVHLGRDKSATALRDALVAIFATLPPGMRRTLTWDSHTGNRPGAGNGSDPTWDRPRCLALDSSARFLPPGSHQPVRRT